MHPLTHPSWPNTTLPRPFVALSGANLAAQSAEQISLAGVGPILWTISSTTLRQAVTPQAMLGRVSAIFLTVNMGARPLGAAIGGLVGALGRDARGAAACLVLALVGFCVQALLIFNSPVRALLHLPAAAATPA